MYILGIYRNTRKEHGNYYNGVILGLGFRGIMAKKMETTIVYWGYIGIMEKKMETLFYGFGFRVWDLGG